MRTILLFLITFCVMSNANAWVDRGMELTKEFEGYSDTPYLDTEGVLTIGYGFNCEFTDCTITKEEADFKFLEFYGDAIRRAIKFSGSAWDSMTDNQKIVIADMAYNLGNRLFKFKRLQQALLNGDTLKMVYEMRKSNWYHQTGNRPERLINILEEK